MAAGLPAAAGVAANADGTPWSVLVAVILLATLGGAGAGYLLAGRQVRP